MEVTAIPVSCVLLVLGLTAAAPLSDTGIAAGFAIMTATTTSKPTTTITDTTATTDSSPCLLQHYHNEVHADCRGRNLTSIPRSWPDHVVWLDMSGNDITELGHGDLDQPELRSLRHLDLSDNELKGRLGNEAFVDVPELKVLLLNHNRLDALQPHAMKGLNQLTVLDLSFNRLQLDYDTYPVDVFRPLVSLQELYLLGNDQPDEGCYPDKIFQPLKSLTALSIDAFPYCELTGAGFRALKKLRLLKMQNEAGSSRLKYLTNTTLSAFRDASLEELYLGSQHLVAVDICAFCGLPKLKFLSVTGVTVSVKTLLSTLYGLQHQNMTLINFEGSQSVQSVALDWVDMRYLGNVCVSRLILRNTNIQRITNKFVQYGHARPFTDCLEHLDLSENLIVGDNMAFFMAINMKSIKSAQMQRQVVFSLETAKCALGQDRTCYEITPKQHYGNITIDVSPTLQLLNLSAAIHRLGSLPDYLIILNSSSLKEIDVSYAQISNCNTTILGLTALEKLDMSGNHCYNISETIFDTLPTLRRLRLSNFDLNPQFFRSRGRRLFKNLRQLESLDLSLNGLVNIDPFMLSAQQQLRQVILAGNVFESIPFDLSTTSTLRELDLTNNKVHTLHPKERRELDRLTSAHNFTLRLRGNPLLCACSNLDFVRWLWATRVRLDGAGRGGKYTCVLDTGEVTDTASFMHHYGVHWRRCIGPRVLGGALAAFLLQLLGVLTTFIISRSWTHIIYMIKVMRHLRLPQRRHFRKDVYVGYADADWRLACVTLLRCLQQRHGIRLLLRDRDELPGTVRAENVIDHIDDSWKVLLLVTRAFAVDEWLCGFTVHQAQRSITDTLPDRVLVLFLDDPRHLPPMASLEKLLRMVPERNVLHVLEDVTPRNPVWDRLARAILGDQHGM